MAAGTAGDVPDGADVVVIGSGSAGLTAALRAASLGASVLLLERATTLGGTTAISGGVIWAPCHFAMHWLDAGDTPAAARAYILGEGGALDEALVDAFVANASLMARFVEEHTLINWIPLPWPDYHSEAEGASATRSLLPGPFPSRALGDVSDLVLAPVAPRPRNPLPAPWLLARLRGMWFAGRALVGGLLEGCLRLGVEVRTGVRAIGLTGADGSVDGVVVDSIAGERTVRADRGVVLASGGFEWSDVLAAEHLGSRFDLQLSPPGHEGEALAMAGAIGAAVAHLDEAWWMPAFAAADDAFEGAPVGRPLLGDRGLPGTIVVNRRGERFANESESYSDFGRAMRRVDPETGERLNDPAWMIFDERYRRRYGAPGGSPAGLTTAQTVGALARACRIDEGRLVETVDAFNRNARLGRDPDFHRGLSAYDRFFGDDRRFPALRPWPWLETASHGIVGAVLGPPATRLAARAAESDGDRVRRLAVPRAPQVDGPAVLGLGPRCAGTARAPALSRDSGPSELSGHVRRAADRRLRAGSRCGGLADRPPVRGGQRGRVARRRVLRRRRRDDLGRDDVRLPGRRGCRHAALALQPRDHLDLDNQPR